MNKKLLAAAIAAAAVLPMSAQAGVQVYGVIHASIDYVDPENDAQKGFWDVTSSKGRSRLGFKGSEDLGNGLKAIWKVESEVNMDNKGDLDNDLNFNDSGPGADRKGAGTFSNRNAYIGLAGDWGTFLYGRHDTPLKISTGKLDLFADTMADYNSTVGFIDRRVGDAIAYISPNMNGLTFAGAIVPGHDAANGGNGIADGYSVALLYSNNGFFASAAYEDVSDWATDGAADVDHWRVGLGYSMNAFSVGVVYEDQDLGGVEADLYQVSASYNFGNNVIKGMWGQNDPDAGDELDSWAIGLDHNLSKRTKAYVMYADSENQLHNSDSDSDGTLVKAAKGFSMGVKHKF